MRRTLVAAARRCAQALRPSLAPALAMTLVLGLLTAPPAALAGPIPSDTFLQFSFDGAVAVAGCAPNDALGGFCIPSSGTPTTFLDAPAWTFVAAVGGATLSVVDAFESGDAFQIFDFGVLVGSTSVPIGGVDCGDDPVACLAKPGMSMGVFALAAGAHSLSLVALNGSGLGSGYLQVTGAQAVAEPASLALTLAALAAAWRTRRGRADRTDQGARA